MQSKKIKRNFINGKDKLETLENVIEKLKKFSNSVLVQESNYEYKAYANISNNMVRLVEFLLNCLQLTFFIINKLYQTLFKKMIIAVII